MKCGGLGIPYPWLLADHAHNTYKAANKVLVGSLLGGTDLNHIEHKVCVCISSADGRKQQELAEKAVLTIWKEQADRAGLNCLRQATYNVEWLTAIPNHLNVTEFSWEKFQDNILLKYGVVPLNLPTDCNGCANKFLVPHAL